jgi:hypothetical protein
VWLRRDPETLKRGADAAFENAREWWLGMEIHRGHRDLRECWGEPKEGVVMNDRVSTASWNLVADSFHCGLKVFDVIADTISDGLDWGHDFLASRSASDLVSVWSKHSARQMCNAITQGQATRELNWTIWADCVALGRASGLLPATTASAKSETTLDTLTPEQEVLLLHVIE